MHQSHMLFISPPHENNLLTKLKITFKRLFLGEGEMWLTREKGEGRGEGGGAWG